MSANNLHEEDYVIRASKKSLDIGIPICPCGVEFVQEVKEEEENEN